METYTLTELADLTQEQLESRLDKAYKGLKVWLKSKPRNMTRQQFVNIIDDYRKEINELTEELISREETK
jgi:hypothetical protein